VRPSCGEDVGSGRGYRTEAVVVILSSSNVPMTVPVETAGEGSEPG
jgi:hypothetical protein